MTLPYFESLNCRNCRPWPIWKSIAPAGIYCICLQEREDRKEASAKQFHKYGLCQYVTYYRPMKHSTNPREGSWNSHLDVIKHAKGSRVLVMEDDVLFADFLTEIHLETIWNNFASAKAWDIFYLGHFPFFAIPYSDFVLRTFSTCIHAYIVNLESDFATDLKHAKFQKKAYADGLDIFIMTKAKRQYAAYPMIAYQSNSPTSVPTGSNLLKKIPAYIIAHFETFGPIAERCATLYVPILVLLILFVFLIKKK